MDDTKFKHIYSLVLLALTVGWAALCVWVTFKAVGSLQATDIVAASGASVLLGALIKMASDVNQFWFRKKEKKEGS